VYDSLNGGYLLTAMHVHDDGTTDREEGDSGLDWFFAMTGGTTPDEMTDPAANEIPDPLGPII
jgi:hypothetical protein